MIWNGISDEERLHLWKDFRKSMADVEFHKQLLATAKFYAAMPYGSRTLDYYNPVDWPTPWEILYHGSFCKSSISLLIFHTIAMISSGHKLEMHLVDDNGDIYLLPVIDDQNVLNYELGVVSSTLEINKDLTVLRVFPQSLIKAIT